MLFLSLLSPVAAAQTDVVCEAVTLFKEASTEPLDGKRAVLDSIRNRAATFKKCSCWVVKQKNQFSFVNKNFKWYATKDMLTTYSLVSSMNPVVPNAWYFNRGKRIKKYKFICKIKNHNFYTRE